MLDTEVCMDILREIKMLSIGQQVVQLSSLLRAVLKHTGPIYLSEKEASEVQDSGVLKSEPTEDGGLRIWLA